MELSRFIESLPPSELCASAAPGDPMEGNLPGQMVGQDSLEDVFNMNDSTGRAATTGQWDPMATLCARWSQPELEDLKRQLGTLQEAMSTGMGSLQRVREKCYPPSLVAGPNALRHGDPRHGTSEDTRRHARSPAPNMRE